MDHAEIGLAREGVERAVAVGKEVEDFRARVFIQQFDGVTEAAGGSVVSVTESGRQDENLFHIWSDDDKLNGPCYGNVSGM